MQQIFIKICKISPISMDLFVSACVCVCVYVCVCMSVCVCYNPEHRSYISENKNVQKDVFSLLQLPSIDVIANIVLSDVDTLF